MNEEIKPIGEIGEYHISNTGVVYTTQKSKRYNKDGVMRVLKPRNHPSGYLYVGLYQTENGRKKRYWRRVHRLVAEYFIGVIPEGYEVNHKDLDKHNNHIDNLEIVTRRQNLIHYHANKNK